MTDFALRYRLAAAALDRGDPAETRRICSELIALQPGHADSHFLLGMAEANAGNIREALPRVQKAVDLDARADYLAQLARLLVVARRDAEALQCVDRAAAAGPRDALSLDTIGGVYSRLGLHAKAAPIFAQAVAIEPDHPQMRFNYAAALGFLGQFEAAEQQYEAAIELNPRFVRAHSALSALRTQTPQSNHVARLESLLAGADDAVDTLHLHYALAKEHEDLRNTAAVFHHLDTANRRRKAELRYTIDFDRGLFERLTQRFTEPEYFTGLGHFDDKSKSVTAPIFVLGMPRTGTTLVDRILSSHPQIESAGELQVMQLALKRLARTQTRFALDAQTIDAARNVRPADLGALYVQNAAPFRKTGRRFIDKLPLNFLYIGYIARALPDAKIVCLRRHPLDTVWSNYRHLFATQFSYYNYSYDLLDSAAYYVMFDRLMQFWEQRFPGRVLQVRYENLVDDLEAATRPLLAHCGLDWSERCLRFHENDAAVATPSATQVRQPIYKGARGRWRRYEPQLAPARAYLEAQGISVE
jgi:cytochrome c-type biogenesis protein CcmH/NrfG